MILVDTNVWSVALRRGGGRTPEQAAVVEELRRLVVEDLPVGVPGAVLQEVLSGVRHQQQFERLRRSMGGFPLLLADAEDHIEAARINNRCRSAGVAVTAIDCLIAAQAVRSEASLWSLDQDFVRMARHCGVELYSGGAGVVKQ